MHALLIASLYWGVQWQRRPAEAVSVELVRAEISNQVQKPAPMPPPAQVEAPKPPSKPQVEKLPDPIPAAKPDIALKETKKKPEPKKEEPKPEPPRPDKKPEPPKPEKKPEPQLSPMERLMQRDLERLEASKQQSRLDQAAAKAAANAKAAEAATGRAKAISNWEGKVAAKVRGNMSMLPVGLRGRPITEFEVNLLPDGTFRSPPVMARSSGNSQIDDLCRRAIQKSEPFPKPPEEAVGVANKFLCDPLDPDFSH